MKRSSVEAPASLKRSVAALFAGIGGIELGLKRAGFCASFFCEIDTGANAVLNARFPGTPIVADVRAVERLPEDTLLLTAGFPCQDLSQAGATRGISGSRSGLVSHVFRLLEGGDVPWVLIENVPFMLQLEGGRAIREIVVRFEELGYAWAYRTIDSRAFGVPQRRERVYLLASRLEDPATILFQGDEAGMTTKSHRGVACGFYWTEGVRGLGWAVDAVPTMKGGSTIGIPSPPAIWTPDGDIVTPDIRDAERLQGFPENWTKPAEGVVRKSMRWKLVGNAVTPAVPEWIGRTLLSATRVAPPISGMLPLRGSWPAAGYGKAGSRIEARVGMYPVRRSLPHLIDFLRHPTKSLSLRAVTGFVNRLSKSTLRYPPEFMDALERHLKRMEAEVGAT